jgi:hypothetical protein
MHHRALLKTNPKKENIIHADDPTLGVEIPVRPTDTSVQILGKILDELTTPKA